MKSKIRRARRALDIAVRRSYQYIEPSLIPVCLCGMVFMPLFYFVWRDIFPQPHENITLRLIGAALCLALSLKMFWPTRLVPLIPYIWYVTLIFVLPFFVTLMLLRNGSPVWFVTAISGLLLVIVLADWVNMLIINLSGTTLGVIFYVASDGFDVAHLSAIVEYLPILGFALVAGTVFNFRREMVVRELEARKHELKDARDRAVAASSAKSHFLATMSHELRTPLNAILGFSGLMQKEALGPLGHPAYRDYLDDIEASGRRLLRALSEVLDLSEIQAGRYDLSETTFEATKLCARMETLVRDARREAELAIAISLPPELPTIRGDEVALRRALENLVSNAIKFTRGRGTIWISAASTIDGGVRITVADPGIGMAPEVITRAFQPFGQADETLAREYEGMGLGLPLADAIVQVHGGALRIESTVGHGTTVTLELPAARCRWERVPAKGKAKSPGGLTQTFGEQATRAQFPLALEDSKPVAGAKTPQGAKPI